MAKKRRMPSMQGPDKAMQAMMANMKQMMPMMNDGDMRRRQKSMGRRMRQK